MLDINLAVENLMKEISLLQEKNELSSTVGPDYYEPGKMENLDQYFGLYDADTNTITLRTGVKGLRYEERTPRLDSLSIGDRVKLIREPNNPFNENNIAIISEKEESLGNFPAELCNVMAPLMDIGYLTVTDSTVNYLERIRDRSRYAQQGVLFIEAKLSLRGVRPTAETV